MVEKQRILAEELAPGDVIVLAEGGPYLS